MRIFGTVRDAKEEKPIKGARVSLSIAEKELAVLYTDSKGEFETSVSGSYIDEVLICKVEKDGYKSQRITHDIEKNEVELGIELLSVELELNFYVKDEKGNTLQGVKITLKLKEEQIGVGLTNKSGCFKFSLNRGLKGKKIDYYAELAGYEIDKGSLKLKEETSCGIIMEKTARKFNWLPVILGFIGGGLGAFIFLIMSNKRDFMDLAVPLRIVFSAILYGVTLGLGLGLGLKQNMKKILRLVVVSIVGFFIGGLIISPFLMAEKGFIIAGVVWISVVGLSFGIGLRDEKINLKMIIESLTKDIKSTLRLIIAGLITGLIAGFIGSKSQEPNAMIFFVFLIAGWSFGIALGLPKKN